MRPREHTIRDQLWTAFACILMLAAARAAYCVSVLPELRDRFSYTGQAVTAVVAIAAFTPSLRAADRGEVRLAMLAATPTLSALASCLALPVQFFIFHSGRAFRLVDADLARIDAALGFDWTAYFHLALASPALHRLGELAYGSIWWQPLLLVGCLAWRRCIFGFCRLQTALPISFALTCLVATFLPALGAYQFHGMTPGGHPGLPLEFTDGMSVPMLWLRAADFSAMPAFADIRVITFPSWHAAAAIIFVLAAWPMRRIRHAVLLLNLAMMAATPVHGSHYLTDMIVGAALGAAAFAAAHGLLRRPGLSARPALATPVPAVRGQAAA